MSFTVVVTKRVHNQLTQALDWYAENVPGHQKKLLKAFDKTLSYIEENPFRCQVRYDEIRICFLDKYKFGVHYLIEDKTIFILGFFHQHQADENWSFEMD